MTGRLLSNDGVVHILGLLSPCSVLGCTATWTARPATSRRPRDGDQAQEVNYNQDGYGKTYSGSQVNGCHADGWEKLHFLQSNLLSFAVSDRPSTRLRPSERISKGTSKAQVCVLHPVTLLIRSRYSHENCTCCAPEYRSPRFSRSTMEERICLFSSAVNTRSA